MRSEPPAARRSYSTSRSSSTGRRARRSAAVTPSAAGTWMPSSRIASPIAPHARARRPPPRPAARRRRRLTLAPGASNLTRSAREPAMPSLSVDEARRLEARRFIPVVKRHPAILVEGRGSRVRDAAGREYLDLMAGWAVCCLGHSHPALVRAISEQAGRLMQTTNVFYNEPQLELIERLAGLTRGALPYSFLVNSGTEAMEGALKLAHRATGRARFVSTEGSFHGRTLGALRLIGNPKHRDPYAALLPPPALVPFDDLEAARRAIDASTAAFVVEPIQGEGGVHVPRAGYLRGLRELCDAAGALLVADEVQTGIGRTGSWLAVEREGVVPDVVTLGKGLGGGFPVGAFLATEAVARTVQLGDHGTTYGGNPLACAAANAVLRAV